MQPTMRPLAQAIQAQGRGKDTMLVHMTPREVGGLQALALAHGGSLTINPETGLPEAGFLDSLLPTLLGVGLSFVPGVGPLMAAGIVGGGTALATGDIGKGLMAGLGAYGGAGLGQGLLGAGAQQGLEASVAAGNALGDQTARLSGELVGENARDMLLARSTEALPASVAALPNPVDPTFGSQLAQAGQGAQNLFSSGATGDASRAAFLENAGGGTGLAMKGAAIAAPAILGSPQPLAPIEPEKSNYAGPYKPQPRSVRYPVGRDPNDSSEFTYFSPMNPYPGFTPAAAGGGQVPAYEEGGIAALGKKKMPPRFLSGGGDGMSDSIPAVIDDKQPARLADGEFVVPADVVSHIGNGSSKAGAKKLYAMMDRVRKARTGKTRQAPEVNTHRMMPA